MAISYDLNSDGSKGALLANGSTADDGSGRFSVMLPSRPAGGVLIEVTGGTYTSAYDGTTVASQKISAMLGSVSAAGESGLSVNPLTDISIGVTRTYISQRYSLAASLSAADKWVSWAFGLKTAPSRIVPKFDVTQAATDPEAVHLALVLAALDTLGKRLSATDPDAIFASLSADFSDGFFDGRNASQQVTLNGSAMAAATGTTEFLKAFAVTLTGTAAGWRPTYLDAHFSAGTVIERYEARIIPVYVASELAAYFPPKFTTPLPETTSLDTSATGYSCPAEAPISFSSSGVATCGSYNTCSSGTLVMSGTRLSCSDGGMVIYHSSTIAPYTAPTLVPYSASTMNSYLAATTIGEPSSGTIPVFRATAAHIFTQAEREAMMANDRAAGDAAAAKVSGLGVPNDLQMEWLKKIGDAMVASVGR